MHLGQAGEADGDPVPVLVIGDRFGELLHEVGPFRPRADQTHVASEYVPELGHLVDRGGPTESGERRDPVRSDAPGSVRFRLGGGDGPELEHREAASFEADPFLPEEHAGAVLEPEHEGAERDRWREHGDQHRGEHHIDDPLQAPAKRAVRRRPDRDERHRRQLLGPGDDPRVPKQRCWEEIDLWAALRYLSDKARRVSIR